MLPCYQRRTASVVGKTEKMMLATMLTTTMAEALFGMNQLEHLGLVEAKKLQ